jgi:hypothetical protein
VLLTAVIQIARQDGAEIIRARILKAATATALGIAQIPLFLAIIIASANLPKIRLAVIAPAGAEEIQANPHAPRKPIAVGIMIAPAVIVTIPLLDAVQKVAEARDALDNHRKVHAFPLGHSAGGIIS